MLISGNQSVQSQINTILRSPYRPRMLALVGPSKIGKSTFLRQTLSDILDDSDIIWPDHDVDSARAALSSSIFLPSSSPFKVVVLDNVDVFSDPAKDAYLKICEEPPHHCVVILVLEDEGLLPPALSSRITHLFRWGRLTPDEMALFASGLDHVPDPKLISMCGGRPGFYLILLNNPAIIDLPDQMASVLNGRADCLAHAPPAVKDLKSGASPEREAISYIIRCCVHKTVGGDPARLCRLLDFSSSLVKFPSINAELHWHSALI